VPGVADPVADGLRAGSRALLLLADPVSISILCALAAGPVEGSELIERVENVSRSTYFDRLRDLEEIHLINRERRSGIPPVAVCSLTDAGRCLLRVSRLLEAWLARAPQGPLSTGSASATTAIKALAVGWGSTLLRWLAERPRSLTELEPLVDGLGYRKLERATKDLLGAGLVERVDAEGRLSPYALTPWARDSVAVLAAAVHWERSRIPDRSTPVTALEIEAGMLMALPLLELPSDSGGTCELLMDVEGQGGERVAGAVTRIAHGRPVWCSPAPARLPEDDTAFLRGDLWAWLRAVIKGEPSRLNTGGDPALTLGLIAALRRALLLRRTPDPGQVFDAA
jgi:DNA-binding HxlR family transcriptional regulator